MAADGVYEDVRPHEVLAQLYLDFVLVELRTLLSQVSDNVEILRSLLTLQHTYWKGALALIWQCWQKHWMQVSGWPEISKLIPPHKHDPCTAAIVTKVE